MAVTKTQQTTLRNVHFAKSYVAPGTLTGNFLVVVAVQEVLPHPIQETIHQLRTHVAHQVEALVLRVLKHLAQYAHGVGTDERVGTSGSSINRSYQP
jgi:hypothetical protein